MADMESTRGKMINILLTSFPGLGLPSTLCLPVPAESTIADFTASLAERLPPSENRKLILTTANNKQLSLNSPQTISSLLAPPPSAPTSTQHAPSQLLTLRLSAPLCGGKGGFGSQLRAAGGRMSSRKKRTNDAAANGSNRNLDGRRLRTVTEAKALAEYLALKPEMDKKEKEARREKWEAVVEAAERKQEEILSGKGTGKARGDAEWLERKEEAEAKIRDAVAKAVKDGLLASGSAAAATAALSGGVDSETTKKDSDVVTGDEAAEDEDMDSSEEENGEGPSGSSKATTPEEAPQRKIFGWDDDEDDDEEDE